MENPPDTLTPLKGNKNVSLDKLKITKKIDIVIRCFKSIKTKKTPNPADELERVKQIIQELEKVDQLITNLLK